MFHIPFGFRSLTATSAVAVASLTLGVAAAGLAASVPRARADGHVADVPEINSITKAVWLPGTRVPTGDVQIGLVSYHAGRTPEAHRARGKIVVSSLRCVEGWRGLENGPVGRQVLVSCPGAMQGTTRVTSSRIEPKTEHLQAPASVHDRLIRAYSAPLDVPQARPARNP